MYLTVCPLYGPDHDSSVGEWMYLTVCPLYMAWIMIAQWENGCISVSVLSMARVTVAGYLKGFCPGWSHSANPAWANVAENGSISFHLHHKTCGNRGGRPKSNHGQKMTEVEYVYDNTGTDLIAVLWSYGPPLLMELIRPNILWNCFRLSEYGDLSP